MSGKPLSSEKVTESDVESESSSSASESDSAESVEAPLSQKRKKPATTSERASAPQNAVKRTKTAKAQEVTPASTDGSSSEDDDDEQMKDTNTDTPNGTTSSRTVSKDYTPPDGFIAVKGTSTSTNTELDELFSPENLAGKQIWHITLASGIPITSLKEVDLTEAQSGTTIIKHDGVEFGLRVESQENTGKDGLGLLVPTDGGAGYSSAAVTFNTALHVQQSSHPTTAYSIPTTEKADGTQGAGHPTIPKAKAVRQQPKGLRMRFWPAGFESSGPDMSQADTDVSGRPESLGLKEAAAKRGATSSSSESSSESDQD